jgi:hypothetical protein
MTAFVTAVANQKGGSGKTSLTIEVATALTLRANARSSSAQIAANQANAQHSTGPKTGQGKATSCLSNFRHGLAGGFSVLSSEDQLEYDVLLEGAPPGTPTLYHDRTHAGRENGSTLLAQPARPKASRPLYGPRNPEYQNSQAGAPFLARFTRRSRSRPPHAAQPPSPNPRNEGRNCRQSPQARLLIEVGQALSPVTGDWPIPVKAECLT